MPYTDEELAELQKSVEAKRQELAAAQAEREISEKSNVNDIAAAQLMEESVRLDAAIQAEKALAERAAGSGDSAIAAATATMEQAVATAKAQQEAEAAAAQANADAEAQAEAAAAGTATTVAVPPTTAPTTPEGSGI